MKKYLTFAMSGVLACTLAAGLSACSEGEHQHTYGEWKTVKEATLFEDGQEERVCSEDAEHKETRTTDALGKTPDVFKFFTTYADSCTQGEKGIVLNKDTENGTGASTYFGEDDKNYDWDGAQTTISFDLDLSGMQENDFSVWVLAFNKQTDDGYAHVNEIRFGIAKTADGFVVNELTGVAFDDETDLANILAGDKTFTESEVTASFTVAFDSATKQLSYTMTVGGQELTNAQTMTEDIVGLRSLWNAYLKGDGIELSNLTKK